MSELRKPQENATLSNTVSEYFNPENSNPSTFRRFLSNLADNIAELTLTDKTAPEYEDMGSDIAKDIGSYATRYQSPEFRDRFGLEPAEDEHDEEAKMLAAMATIFGGKGMGAEKAGEADLKVFLKRMPDEEQKALRYSISPMRYVEKQKEKIQQKKADVSEMANKFSDVLENKIPITKMGEQPNPDQAKYVSIFEKFKDEMRKAGIQ